MNKIRLSKSSISSLEKQAVIDVLEQEYLGMGTSTQAFEIRVSEYLGIPAKNVVSVNTGTSALHIALVALDIGPGDEVLVPSLTYVASFQAISATGAVPIACEVNEDTLFIDEKDAKSKITRNTKAIMPVHYASSCKGIEAIYELAKEFNLRVIEDAAQAFGSFHEGKVVGSVGDVICFSFDGIKNITCGEGGAVVSADEIVLNKVKDMRLLGVEKDTEKRYQAQRSWDYDVFLQGFRYHLSNINAAIGIEQLKRLQIFKNKRQSIVQSYIDAFRNFENVKFLALDYNSIMPHIFVVLVDDRDGLREYLLSKNIECGIHYKPNHLLTKYKIEFPLPITEAIYSRILTLPCHFDLSQVEIDTVIEKVKEFYGK
ncbi:DegT/DnrJ/EryC1/StrS family aminotransferase [Shewanella sp. PP-Sp27a-2]